MDDQHSRRRFKIGLKVWSTNFNYFNSAKELYEQGEYDFIELFAVPGSFELYMPQWRDLSIPCTLHAPHFMQGVNLALREKEGFNKTIYDEVKKWADELDVDTIVFHPGIGGDIKESARQLKSFNDPRILVENKPLIPPLRDDLVCNGATIEEVEYVIKEADVGFCLDIGHCFCAANSLGINPMRYFENMLSFSPSYFHLSDNKATSEVDAHKHFGDGDMPIENLMAFIPAEAKVAIETVKDSPINLDDFKKDVFYLEHHTPPFLLRKAVIADMGNVYNLSNEREVRKQSTNSSSISWDEHCTWFTNKIKDSNTLFYVIENDQQQFIGQFRLEKKNDGRYYYSLSLSPIARGKGIATCLLNICTQFTNTPIYGYIKHDNAASIKTAEKAGFKQLSEDGVLIQFIKEDTHD